MHMLGDVTRLVESLKQNEERSGGAAGTSAGIGENKEVSTHIGTWSAGYGSGSDGDARKRGYFQTRTAGTVQQKT